MPAVEFDRFAADGGDLDPGQQNRLEEQGTVIKSGSNDHDDLKDSGRILSLLLEKCLGTHYPDLMASESKGNRCIEAGFRSVATLK